MKMYLQLLFTIPESTGIIHSSNGYSFAIGRFVISLSLLVFSVACNEISVIFVTAQMYRQTEEVVPTVGLPTP